MSQIENDIDTSILELEVKIGLREGFFAGLLTEDDWSFVIKLHALIEAACTHLLSDYFQDQNLSTFFSKLEFNDKERGIISFLEDNDLIGRSNSLFVSSLSDLRDSLVHDMKDHEFSLLVHLNSLDNQQMNHFATAFSPEDSAARNMKDSLDLRPEMLEKIKLENVIIRAKEDPKYFIWFGAYTTLVALSDVCSF